MAFRREKINDLFLMDTRVENMFINEYMATAPGDYVKIYLIAQMYTDAGMSITNEDIAKTLGIEVEDVLKAWNYWEKKGIIRKVHSGKQGKLDYDVELINLREGMYGTSPAPVNSDYSVQSSMGDREIQEMLSTIEKMMGSVMNGTEVTEIISWINDYRVTPDVVIYAFKYSLERKKRNIKYVEAVIRNWSEDGLTDVESIEHKLSMVDKRQYMYSRVFKALGFNRNSTEEERRIMDTWFDDMEFSIDKVLEACKKTSGISSPNINYVNKVLANWHEEQANVAAGGRRADVTAGDITRYYEIVRESNEKIAEAHRHEVFAKVPRIKEIEDELIAAASEMMKLTLSKRTDKQEAIDKLKEQSELIRIEEAFLLTDNGFDVDYMETRYACDKCKDTGVLETGERCQCQSEVTREKIDLLMKSKQAK
ncbi:MAG: DnaD domain protein [Bacillota bacterium]|nr:DnaD domain protein [Bacillota bacterium]